MSYQTGKQAYHIGLPRPVESNQEQQGWDQAQRDHKKQLSDFYNYRLPELRGARRAIQH